MNIKYGFQEIKYLKKGTSTEEDVDWDSWSLRLNKNDLHQLDVELMYPDDWINMKSSTGIRMDIGDELFLKANFGNKDTDIRRFGGLVSEVTGRWSNGSPRISVKALDYRYALKNRIVFNKFKTIPMNVGQYSYLMSKIKTSNSVYDVVSDLCNLVGYSDLTNVTNPYKFKKTGASLDVSKTTGANATVALTDLIGNPPPGYKFTFGSGDAEVVFKLYEDGSGFDISEYPIFAFNYHLPPFEDCLMGLRFTINGELYYLPWFDNLNDYTGVNKLRGLTKTYTNTISSMLVPLTQLMREQYPDTVYNLTKIELISKRTSGNVFPGTFYMDNIGMIDSSQALPMLDEYEYKDALSIINEYAEKTNHLFQIDPYKKPTLINIDSYIRNNSIIEGENLISADHTFNDSELVNNLYVMSKLEDTKALLCQSYNKNSHNKYGLYEKVEEDSNYKTRDDILKYSDRTLGNKSVITPTLTCTIVPTFNINVGEIIYVYIPSLGIEKSLEIIEINYSNSNDCTVTLGNPSEPFIKILKRLDKGQKLGQTRSTFSLDKVNTNEKRSRFTKVYRQPKGKIYMSGIDLVEPNVDLNRDVDSNGSLLWMSDELKGNVIVDERGITINWGTITKNLLPFRCSCPVSTGLVGTFWQGTYVAWGTSPYTSPSSLKVTPSAGTFSTYFYKSQGTVTVDDTKKHSMAIMLKGATVAGNIKLGLRCYDAGGVQLASVQSADIPVTSTSYKQYKYENFSLPANTDNVEVYLTGSGLADSAIHIDCIQLNEGSTINEYEDGGGYVMIPVGIVIKGDRFDTLNSVQVGASTSIGGGIMLQDIYYSELDPLDYTKNIIFKAWSWSMGTDLTWLNTSINEQSPLKSYHNILKVNNGFENPFGAGTTTIEKKELYYLAREAE